jgi:hypothetical protein
VLSLTGGFTPSLAVSVALNTPSSAQVIVVRALCWSANEHDAPASTPLSGA